MSYLDSVLIEIRLWRESDESDYEAILSGLYNLDVCSAAWQGGQGVNKLPGLRRLTQDSCSINSSYLKANILSLKWAISYVFWHQKKIGLKYTKGP